MRLNFEPAPSARLRRCLTRRFPPCCQDAGHCNNVTDTGKKRSDVLIRFGWLQVLFVSFWETFLEGYFMIFTYFWLQHRKGKHKPYLEHRWSNSNPLIPRRRWQAIDPTSHVSWWSHNRLQWTLGNSVDLSEWVSVSLAPRSAWAN